MRSFDLWFRPSPRRRCRVRVGAGALHALVEELAAEWPRALFALVADDRVAPLHAEPLVAGLRARGLRAELIGFAEGEVHKSRETAFRLEDRLYEVGAGRDTVVVGMGGGVSCDLAGFVASVWHRGVPVVQVPTSVLAMVDAAVGGKTGVNVHAAKNLVGTIHQPWGVFADVTVLDTLPTPEVARGLAEVVKIAAVGDAGFFRWLESAWPMLAARDVAALERVVVRSIELKGRFVARDEREAGPRAALNFGHTLAHAIEAVTAYRVPHGEAVAAGLVLEARIATRVTGFPAAHVQRLEALLLALGLPSGLPQGVGAPAVVTATRRDKKARDGVVRYALPRRLGRMPRIACTAVGDDVVRDVLAASHGSAPR